MSQKKKSILGKNIAITLLLLQIKYVLREEMQLN